MALGLQREDIVYKCGEAAFSCFAVQLGNQLPEDIQSSLLFLIKTVLRFLLLTDYSLDI